MGFTYLHETAIKFDLFSICDQRFEFGHVLRELGIKGQKYRSRVLPADRTVTELTWRSPE